MSSVEVKSLRSGCSSKRGDHFHHVHVQCMCTVDLPADPNVPFEIFYLYKEVYYLALGPVLVASHIPVISLMTFFSCCSQLQPDARRAFESRPKCNLHDSMSLLERIGLLMLLDVFKLIPDGGGTGVAIIQQGHTRWFRVEELQLHILLNACRDKNHVKR